MEIIDAQVHVWEDQSHRPWDPTFVEAMCTPGSPAAHYTRPPVTASMMLDAMGQAEVDAAILVSSVVYGPDPGYALSVAADHMDRFRVVCLAGPDDPAIEETVAEWRRKPQAAGMRVILQGEADIARFRAGRYDRFFAAAEREQVPVCLYPYANLDAVGPIAAAFPSLQLVIDHLGMPPPVADVADSFETLPAALDLARFPNVAIKLTGVASHSKTAYPFADVWPALHRVIEAFGLERSMWGTDWTRTGPKVSYAAGVNYIKDTAELSASDKEMIMGRTLRRIFRWPE